MGVRVTGACDSGGRVAGEEAREVSRGQSTGSCPSNKVGEPSEEQEQNDKI